MEYAARGFCGGESGYTVREFIDEWLKHCVRHTVKARTYAAYSETARLHITPILGGLMLRELTGAGLQRFMSGRLTGGNLKTGGALSAASAELIRVVLSLALAAAAERGLLTDNPMGGVKRFRNEGKKAEAFTTDEQRKIEEYITAKGKPEYIGIMLSLYTGLRLGELLALEWADVDFKQGFLSVTKTARYERLSNTPSASPPPFYLRGELNDGSNPATPPVGSERVCRGTYGFITDTPKSRASRRVIPLPKDILPLLKEAKRNAKSKYVIARGDGKRIPTHSYQYGFQALLRKCGVRPRPFHTLRHTFATRALEIGMDAKTVSELLGHSSAAFTLNRYAHSMTEYKARAMNKLGILLYGRQTKSPVYGMNIRGSPTG